MIKAQQEPLVGAPRRHGRSRSMRRISIRASCGPRGLLRRLRSIAYRYRTITAAWSNGDFLQIELRYRAANWLN